jgi:hypothetical protein
LVLADFGRETRHEYWKVLLGLVALLSRWMALVGVQYCSDGSGCQAHNPSMSQAAWFRQKADECARQAKNASEPDRRDRYESQAEEWRLIAEQIEAGERKGFGSDPQ